MATFAQKSDFVSNTQQLTSELIRLRGQFLVLLDQYNSQYLGNQITQEELDKITGGIDKASLPEIVALLDKTLQFGGAGELTVLYNFKK